MPSSSEHCLLGVLGLGSTQRSPCSKAAAPRALPPRCSGIKTDGLLLDLLYCAVHIPLFFLLNIQRSTTATDFLRHKQSPTMLAFKSTIILSLVTAALGVNVIRGVRTRS